MWSWVIPSVSLTNCLTPSQKLAFLHQHCATLLQLFWVVFFLSTYLDSEYYPDVQKTHSFKICSAYTCQFWEIHTLVYYRYLSLPNSLCSDFSLLCWIDFNTHSQISHCCSKPGSTWFVINLFLPQSRSPKQNGVWLVLTCATFLQSHAGSKNSEV